MKKETHPKYYKDAKITCACGAVHSIGSTIEAIQVELCSKCHPFFTGEKQKMLDTARRVEKFTERTAKKSTVVSGKKIKKIKRAATKAAKGPKFEEEDKGAIKKIKKIKKEA
ncbi:MAG: 50S ribosomal protein L31 [Candidatus Uhrbacteria bacterium]|jgi:large subunit ribosomal protein L31